jgi:hypothetical protein
MTMKLELGTAYNTSGESPLLCPVCGGNNLHHGEVEVFTRKKEDSAEGAHVTVRENGWADADRDMTLNPSARRDGVLIHLSCEGGCGPFVLQIAQHKGETLVQIGEVKRVIQWGGK